MTPNANVISKKSHQKCGLDYVYPSAPMLTTAGRLLCSCAGAHLLMNVINRGDGVFPLNRNKAIAVQLYRVGKGKG